MILSNIFSNTSELYRTLQLLISLSALTVIAWLFLKYYILRREAENYGRGAGSNSTSYSKWIHTLYIGGIATFLLLEFIVYIVLNNDEKDNIIDTISFGATLSSLIMSVVAIIFTIVHGRNGETQLGQITQATQELKTSASSLVGFKEIANDIDKHIENFHTQINEKILNLNQSINDKITKINDVLKEVKDKTTEVREHQKFAQNQTTEGNSTKSNSKFSVVSYLMAGSYLGALALLACYYSKEKDKKVNFEEIKSAFGNTSLDYVYGYLIASCGCGIIEISGDFPEISTDNVITGLKNACFKKITNFLKTSKPQFLDEEIANLNIITDYFGEDPFHKDDLLK